MKKNGLTVKQEVEVPGFLAESMSLADVFVKSGMFPDLKSQAQGVVKILAGKELGLAPLESLTNIYIVNGKVALQAKVISSLIKKSKKYDYTIDQLTETECTLTFLSVDADGKRAELGKSSFTFKDAAKAGLVNKDVWKNYPRNMLFARAISNGARWYTSDVYCGYTAEEVESVPAAVGVVSIDEKGEVVNNESK